MKFRFLLLTAFISIHGFGCTFPVDHSVSVTSSADNKVRTLELEKIKRSIFDPDGFSRTYKHQIRFHIFGQGKETENVKVFVLGEDFDVDPILKGSCKSGQIEYNKNKQMLRVSITGNDYPCEYFNGSHKLSASNINVLNQ